VDAPSRNGCTLHFRHAMEITYTQGVRSIQATTLRRELFETLDRLAVEHAPVEIVRFKRSVAILAPAPSLPASRRKPLIDLDAIAHFCKKHRAKTFALFGSILRNDFDEHSDVDVVVDLDGRHLKFHEECRMLDELEFIFGRKVDMVLAESLASSKMNRHRRASIATTAKVVYDARS
jgi:predicted nucleotidyltransferase